MKNILFIIIGIITVIVITKNLTIDQKPRIFISQIVAHPALDATVKGIKDELIEQGYNDSNLELKIESAQGSSVLAGQIATKFISQDPSLVIGVATIAAQSFARDAKNGKVKLIFSSVTDPLGAGLIKTITRPGNNTSGVSNFVPLEPQLELFKKIQPKLKRLGFLYNPGELNSISLIKQLEEICPKFGLTLVLQTADKSSDVPQAATNLSEKCDCIFISNDNTALSAMSAIIKAATRAKIPVYVSDTDTVEMGAVAALGPNQYNIGRQTGKMAVGILKGEDINFKAVEFPSTTDLYINLEAARKVGIVIPAEIINKAAKVILR